MNGSSRLSSFDIGYASLALFVYSSMIRAPLVGSETHPTGTCAVLPHSSAVSATCGYLEHLHRFTPSWPLHALAFKHRILTALYSSTRTVSSNTAVPNHKANACHYCTALPTCSNTPLCICMLSALYFSGARAFVRASSLACDRCSFQDSQSRASCWIGDIDRR